MSILSNLILKFQVLLFYSLYDWLDIIVCRRIDQNALMIEVHKWAIGPEIVEVWISGQVPPPERGGL